MTMNGIDVSNYQALLDMRNVLADFVVIKTTEGLSYVNPVADKHFQQAAQAGKAIGIYHFMTADDPVAQADYFVAQSKGYFGQALPVLDFEADALRLGVAGAKQFLDRVKDLTGVTPLIYMSKSTVHQFDWSSVAANYGLWAAQYGSTAPTGYQSDPWSDNTGWGVWTNGPAIYQYSSNGRLPGYAGALDLDIAYMDKGTWNKYVGIVGEIKNVAAPTSVVATSAIEQFRHVGGRYTAYNPIHVDAVKLVNGIWQFANYALAGAKADGSDFDWVKNGIPLAVVNRTDGGNNNNVCAGAMVAFNMMYNNGTIDKYDEASDGVGINFVGYGVIWFDALALLNA